MARLQLGDIESARIVVHIRGGKGSEDRDVMLSPVLLLPLVLVFLVLLFEFGTFTPSIAILSSEVLSTSGVFVALLVTGTTFNISSFMGLIMVVRIVAKRGTGGVPQRVVSR